MLAYYLSCLPEVEKNAISSFFFFFWKKNPLPFLSIGKKQFKSLLISTMHTGYSYGKHGFCVLERWLSWQTSYQISIRSQLIFPCTHKEPGKAASAFNPSVGQAETGGSLKHIEQAV